MTTTAAVIGVGRMGRIHTQVVRDLNLSLVGIGDQNSETLAEAGGALGIPDEKRFSDASELLEETRPECVIVATTAPFHSRYTCLAAEAGAKYILCEKPMGVSIRECNEMIDVCNRKGVSLAVNHQMRFMEQYTEPKRIVQSEAFGVLRSVTVVAGNFGMAMNGTHYFEMFRYMTDEAPEEVTAWFSEEKISNPRGPQFEDRAGCVRMTTPGGKRFYLEIGADQGHGMKVIYSGEYGQLVVDELAGQMYLSIREKRDRELPTTRYGTSSVERETRIKRAEIVGSTRAVLEALLNDKNPPTGEDGRLAVAVLIAAYISNENGHIAVRPGDGNLPVDRVFPWA